MKNKLVQEDIEKLIQGCKVNVATVFEKVTVVSVQLESGFVITESSGAVSPKNYDKDLGYEICIRRIIDRLWELEGYVLQKSIYGQGLASNKKGIDNE